VDNEAREFAIPPTQSDGFSPGGVDGITTDGIARAPLQALPMKWPGPSRTLASVERTSTLDMQSPGASPSPWLVQM
jgi:hypothetical protein